MLSLKADCLKMKRLNFQCETTTMERPDVDLSYWSNLLQG